jgi:hypothetical protein
VSELTKAIRSKGYWHVDVHPIDYVGDRIPYTALRSILDRTVVRLRGWDFPHLDGHGTVRHGNHWIGGETDWSYYKEAWQFHQSGHFVYMIGIHEDWTESYEGLAPFRRVPIGSSGLGVGDALFRITESYEFASRLSVTDAGADVMRIEIDLRNIAGRGLYVDDPGRMPMDHDYSFHEHVLRSAAAVTRADLAGRSRELAIDASSEIFARFGWHPARALLQEQQSQLRW